MKAGAVYNDAFRVCHEIYVAARELVNSRVPTTQMQSASKFLWRPDLRPRLVEYVADFARAGERALGKTSLGRNNAVMSTAFLGSTTPRLRGRADRIEKRVPAHAAFGAKKVLSSPKSAWQSRAFRCPETCRGAKEHRVEALKRTGVVGRRNVAGKASLRRYKQVTKGTP